MHLLPLCALRRILLLGFLLSPLHAEDYSRHCQGPGESQAQIVDGTYKGTWEVGVTFRQNLGGSPMTQTIKGGGEFTLKVDRGSFSIGRPANLSKIEGEMKTSTVMQWTLPAGAQANQKLEGQGTLKLDGDVKENQFNAKADHHTSGEIRVTAAMASTSKPQSLNDTVTLNFLAEQGNCDGASGKILSDSLTEMIDMMKEAGFSVELHAWTWRMSRVQEDGGDRIQNFRDELKRKAPSGIVRTREAESKRLSELADRIKKDEPESIRECLWQLWLAHVTQQYESWVQEDTQKLLGYKGDGEGLRERIMRGLETDRSLSLLGLDTCSTAIHERLWAAIQGALADYLKRMADGLAPMARLLDLLRQAELLGAVSPSLEERTQSAVQTQAKQQADITFAQFKNAVQVAKAAKAEPAKDPAVLAACRKALNAEKAAGMFGLEIRQSLDLADSLGMF